MAAQLLNTSKLTVANPDSTRYTIAAQAESSSVNQHCRLTSELENTSGILAELRESKPEPVAAPTDVNMQEE